MKPEYLKQGNDTQKLILISGGWNTTSAFYSHISPREGWDLAYIGVGMAGVEIEIPEQYHTIYLYAWSFGVVTAEQSLCPDRITEAFAICGTPEGIGEKGIPEEIFNGTRDTLSAGSLQKFRRRMLSSVEPGERSELMEKLEGNPDIEKLRAELDLILRVKKKQNIRWRRVYIGTNDKIIPAAAQRRSWEENPFRPDIVETQDGHYMDISKIISETTPDTKITAESFRESQETYIEQANAQGYFARQLYEEIRRSGIRPQRILEIGNGTGMLSRMLAETWPEAKVTFVDLCATQPYGLFSEETYIEADAENWLEEASGEWDLIVSASAIQWFANPKTFFRNSRRLLKSGGVMGCSLFTRGNLRELDEARPSPIHYQSAEEIKGIVGTLFTDWHIEAEEYVMEFESVRGALLHLRDTGVKGGRKVSLPKLVQALREHRLTYNAVLCTGKV